MKTILHNNGIIEIAGNGILIADVSDALGLFFLSECLAVIVHKENIAGSFFDCMRGVHTPPFRALKRVCTRDKYLTKTTYPAACGGVVDLSTGIAGAILQKFSTYRKRMAIVGDFENIQSKALKDFIYESNKTKQIIFVKTREEALKVFTQG